MSEQQGRDTPSSFASEPSPVTEAAGRRAASASRWSLRGRGHRALGLVLILLAACMLFAWWLVHRWNHVFVDDARIAAHVVTVSSEVSGRVVQLPVVTGDHVSKGQLLAAIDREDTTLEIRSLDAELAGLEARRRQLRAEQEMLRTQIASKVAAGLAQIASAEAAHEASKATLKRAGGSHERIRRLAQHKAMSQQEFENARAELEVARQQERVAASEIERARANLVVTRSEEAQMTVLEHRIEILEAQKAALRAQKQQKQADLGRREIRAEFDGIVATVFLEAGEYVSAGSRLLLYHDPARVWIDANVKETHFGRLRLGATASVKVDAYPGMKFSATVERLGGAATSLFALLPSPNPSGNFTKITQRLPIRLSVEQHEGLLRPGMMVELSIDVD